MRKPKADWPYWCKDYTSARHFRATKRKQIRAVLRAIEDLRIGIAFAPVEKDFFTLSGAAENIRDALKVKNWKR